MYLLSMVALSTMSFGQSRVAATGPALPNDPRAFVGKLYRQVQEGNPPDFFNAADERPFDPYLSQSLRHRARDYAACERDWARKYQAWERNHPGEIAKGPFGERGMFSGAMDRSWPQFFHVESVEPEERGRWRVIVRLKLRYGPPPPKWDVWRVAVELVTENGHLAVNDLTYLKDEDGGEEYRLTETYSYFCDGRRFKGTH